MSNLVPFFEHHVFLIHVAHSFTSSVMKAKDNFASWNFLKTTKGHTTSNRAQRDFATTSSQLQSLAAYDSKSSPRMCFHISSSSHTRFQVALDLTFHSHSTSRRIRPRVECGVHYFNFIVQSNFYAWHQVTFDHMSSIAQSATQTTSIISLQLSTHLLGIVHHRRPCA